MIDHLREAGRGGWVDWAQDIFESFGAQIERLRGNQAVALEIEAIRSWLEWAVAYQTSEEEHARLRTDLREVQAIISELNPIPSALGGRTTGKVGALPHSEFRYDHESAAMGSACGADEVWASSGTRARGNLSSGGKFVIRNCP